MRRIRLIQINRLNTALSLKIEANPKSSKQPRFVRQLKDLSLLMKNLFYPEPVSGAAPKVPPTAKITVFSLPARKATAMLCQAQAHPLPIFRYDLQVDCSLGRFLGSVRQR